MTTEEKIEACFRKHQEPLSRKEIAEELGVTERSVARSLSNLADKGIISKIGSSRYSVWCLSENTGEITCDEFSNLRTLLNDNVADAKGASEKLEEKVCEVEDKINKVYLDLIAIMGMFVAVFSLVVNNAERAYDIAQSELKLSEIIEGIVVSNVSTIVAVAALLWLIKHFFGVKKK